MIKDSNCLKHPKFLVKWAVNFINTFCEYSDANLEYSI